MLGVIPFGDKSWLAFTATLPSAVLIYIFFYLSGNHLLDSIEEPAKESPTTKKAKNFDRTHHKHGSSSSSFLAEQSENFCVKQVAEL